MASGPTQVDTTTPLPRTEVTFSPHLRHRQPNRVGSHVPLDETAMSISDASSPPRCPVSHGASELDYSSVSRSRVVTPAVTAPNAENDLPPQLITRMHSIRHKVEYAKALVQAAESNTRAPMTVEERRREMVRLETAKLLIFVGRHFIVREELQQALGNDMNETEGLRFYRHISFAGGLPHLSRQDPPDLTLSELKREAVEMESRLAEINAQRNAGILKPQTHLTAERARSNLCDFLWLIESLELEMPANQHADLDGYVVSSFEEFHRSQSIRPHADVEEIHAALQEIIQESKRMSDSERALIAEEEEEKEEGSDRFVDFSVDKESPGSRVTEAAGLKLLQFMYDAIGPAHAESDASGDDNGEKEDDEAKTTGEILRQQQQEQEQQQQMQLQRNLSISRSGLARLRSGSRQRTLLTDSGELDQSFYADSLSGSFQSSPLNLKTSEKQLVQPWVPREFSAPPPEVKVQPLRADLYEVLQQLYNSFDYNYYFKEYHESKKQGGRKSDGMFIAEIERRLAEQRKGKESNFHAKNADGDSDINDMMTEWGGRSSVSQNETSRRSAAMNKTTKEEQQERWEQEKLKLRRKNSVRILDDTEIVKFPEPVDKATPTPDLVPISGVEDDEALILTAEIAENCFLLLKGRGERTSKKEVVESKSKPKKGKGKGKKANLKGGNLTETRTASIETDSAEHEMNELDYDEYIIYAVNKGEGNFTEKLNIDRTKLDNIKILPLTNTVGTNKSIQMNLLPNSTQSILMMRPIQRNQRVRFFNALSIGVQPQCRCIFPPQRNLYLSVDSRASLAVRTPSPASLARRAQQFKSSSIDTVATMESLASRAQSALSSTRGSQGGPGGGVDNTLGDGDWDETKGPQPAIDVEDGNSPATRTSKKRPPPLTLPSIGEGGETQDEGIAAFSSAAAANAKKQANGEAGAAQVVRQRGPQSDQSLRSNMWKTMSSRSGAGDITSPGDISGAPFTGEWNITLLHNNENSTEAVMRAPSGEPDRAHTNTLSGSEKALAGAAAAPTSRAGKKGTAQKSPTATDNRPSVEQWGAMKPKSEDEAFERNCVALSALQASVWKSHESPESGLTGGSAEAAEQHLTSGKNVKTTSTTGKTATILVRDAENTGVASAKTEGVSTKEGKASGGDVVPLSAASKSRTSAQVEHLVDAVLAASASSASQHYPGGRYESHENAEGLVDNVLRCIAEQEGADLSLKPYNATDSRASHLTIGASPSLVSQPEGSQKHTGFSASLKHDAEEGLITLDGGLLPIGAESSAMSSSSKHQTGSEQLTSITAVSVPFEGYDVALLVPKKYSASQNTDEGLLTTPASVTIAAQKGMNDISGDQGLQSGSTQAALSQQAARVSGASPNQLGQVSHRLSRNASGVGSAHCEACTGSPHTRHSWTEFLSEEEMEAAHGAVAQSSAQLKKRLSMVERIRKVLAERIAPLDTTSTPTTPPLLSAEKVEEASQRQRGKSRARSSVQPPPRIPDSPVGERPESPMRQRIFREQLPGGGMALFVPEKMAAVSPTTMGAPGTKPLLAKEGAAPTTVDELRSKLHGFARVAPMQGRMGATGGASISHGGGFYSAGVPRLTAAAQAKGTDAMRYGALPPLPSTFYRPGGVQDVDDMEAAEEEAQMLFMQDPVRYDCVVDDLVKRATEQVLAEDRTKISSAGSKSRAVSPRSRLRYLSLKSVEGHDEGVYHAARRPSTLRSGSPTKETIVTVTDELDQVLEEQRRAKRIIAYILMEMRRMWQRREMEANAALRMAVDRFIQRSVLFTWRFERRRVLNLHKLIHLLDRRTGRVRGWVPFYAKDSIVQDRFVWEPAPPHLSRQLRVVHHAMCLARQQRLLPIRLVRQQATARRWQRSVNPHLLLGYKRTLMESFTTPGARLRQQRRARYLPPPHLRTMKVFPDTEEEDRIELDTLCL